MKVNTIERFDQSNISEILSPPFNGDWSLEAPTPFRPGRKPERVPHQEPSEDAPVLESFSKKLRRLRNQIVHSMDISTLEEGLFQAQGVGNIDTHILAIRGKASAAMSDTEAVALLTELQVSQVTGGLTCSSFDSRSIGLARLSAANLCEVGSDVIAITPLGRRLAKKAILADYLPEWFGRMASAWKADTAHISSPEVIAEHPAYREIIEMGSVVVPLILKDLETTHAQWFWALREIAGEYPVKPIDHGDVRAMADAWIAWGRDQGYV